MKKSAILLVPLLLFTTVSLAQELSGIWKGTLTQAPGGCFPEYHVELQLTVKNNLVSGVCYHYSDVTNYVKKDIEGHYDPVAKTVSLNERKILTFHIPQECVPCIRYYSLAHITDIKKEHLSGEWGGVVFNTTTSCAPGRITLTRALTSEFDHIQEIKVDTGKIRLDFYDNGEIDGDTVSVLLNGHVLVANQRLALKPVTVEIRVDPDHPEQEITMVGENLGSIPPNTALLLITSGKKRYHLYLKSTENKNAQVRFIYDKHG
ncbi:MAG TPA: hypothetical protein VM187_19150 [Niastella sp.]|nr:hypothetical protein [Niastella sp.]